MTTTDNAAASPADELAGKQSPLKVFLVFLGLGFSSFGGPVAHLGYFRAAFVERLKWVEDRAYADLVALCQFLPGPASSQVGIGIGLSKGGLAGALAAWIGFTAPSALIMMAIGYGVIAYADQVPAGVLSGLKVVAVAVVAQAVWGMARTLTPDAPRVTIAVAAAIAVLAAPTPITQVAVILVGAAIGFILFKAEDAGDAPSLAVPVGKGIAVCALLLFFAFLIGLPLLASAYPNQTLALVDSFYRSGSLVFGGGHVVLPLLQAEVVPPGWVSNDDFLAGYGAAQAMPGPLFTFASYLGTVSGTAPNGGLGALIATIAIFASSFFLVIGVLPFWDGLRKQKAVRRALMGVNAGMVGLLLAALYNPVWTSAILSAQEFMLAMAAFTALMFWRLPPWLVVIATAAGGVGLAALPAIL